MSWYHSVIQPPEGSILNTLGTLGRPSGLARSKELQQHPPPRPTLTLTLTQSFTLTLTLTLDP